MITTIEIIQEQKDAQQTVYRAISGDQQVASTTPGHALDTLERMLAVQGQEKDEGTLIIVQRFRPDAFFTAEQQKRLQELMDRFHDACATGQALSPEEKQELERLVDAEWHAAVERGTAILRQIPRSAAQPKQLRQ
jgi:translation initiation factor 2 beta subunit (eIF-2beta)/eIF-5